MSTHLDCATLNELLDGALPRPAADAARSHLMACAPCAKSYAGLQGAAAAFAAVKTPALSPAFDARVRAALKPAPFPAFAFAAFSLIISDWVAASLKTQVVSTLTGVAGGFLVLISPLLAGKLLSLAGAGGLGGTLVFLDLILLSFGAVAGLGGVFLTRFGTKRA